MEEINMAVLKRPDMIAEGRSKISNLLHGLLAVPPNFFAITMGLAGLAGVWRLAGNLYGFPVQIGDILYLTAAIVYLLLIISFAAKLVLAWKAVIADFKHPVMGPFNSLCPITGMLLAIGLDPHAHNIAQGMFLTFLVITLLFGGWMTGQWIVSKLDGDTLHSGYTLPAVAGGLIGSDGLARFGLEKLGWMSFGLGIIFWLLLSSIILNRLFSHPSLPPALLPTLAIEVAPPAVAGNAYFMLVDGNVNVLTYLLAGYVVLMILVQLRLTPVYSKLTFTPSFWSFTFPYAAVAVYAMRWIKLEHPIGAMLMAWIVLAAVTLLIGGIALRSLVAIWQGKFLPTIGGSVLIEMPPCGSNLDKRRTPKQSRRKDRPTLKKESLLMIPSTSNFDHQTLSQLRDCDPVVLRYRTLFATLDWSVIPEPLLDPSRPGRRPHPERAYVKALLIKVCEHFNSCAQLRRFLIEHPLLVLELGFRPKLAPEAPFGFDVECSVPCDRWLRHKQQMIDSSILHTLLVQTVHALQEAIPGLGETIAVDVKHLYAWVQENNPVPPSKNATTQSANRVEIPIVG